MGVQHVPAVELVPHHVVEKGHRLFHQVQRVAFLVVDTGGQKTVLPVLHLRLFPAQLLFGDVLRLACLGLFPQLRLLDIPGDLHPVGRNDQRGIILLGGSHHTLGEVRGKMVVTVHELQIFALCQPHSHIAGNRKPLIFLVYHRHPGVFGTKPVTDGKAVIRRAIIQHDDLQLLIGLTADAFQTAGNTILRVIHRHDNADERVCHDRDLLLTIRFWMVFTSPKHVFVKKT